MIFAINVPVQPAITGLPRLDVAGVRSDGLEPAPRHDRVEVTSGVSLDPEEDIAEVVVGVHAVERAGRDEALKDGEVLRGCSRAHIPQPGTN